MRLLALAFAGLSLANGAASTPGSAAAVPAPADCAALLRAHLETDLALPYEAFDQAEGQGFRVLAAHRCHREAADLIERYIAANGAAERSLRWHAAQLRASSGETAAAIRHARSVLSESEDFAKQPLRWNDYVLATIAFLERDREALLRHRAAVAAGKDAHFGNALNLKLLDSLVKHYERDYAWATSHIGE
ncbi:MAG TPA: hypothetical protein VFO79_12335 [Xanthomonadales bacterium]|nr:hypothetical protein [Xanthomonadales bacterium]